VRDDALAALWSVQPLLTLPGGTVFMRRRSVNSELTKISTEAGRFFDRYGYPGWLRTHSLLVGRITEAIVSAHSDVMSQARDIALAGYLHDIGRSPLVTGDMREHNELSALILAAEGLAGSVEPARRHAIYTVLDPATAPATFADKIVYVADRRGGMKVESVEARARDTARRHPRYANDIERAIPAAKALEKEVFGGLPFAPEELEAHLIG
jgi:HD superfamily phosphodiesterase